MLKWSAGRAIEEIQRNYRVNITGPSTMAAFLNSLSMGFRTLAIQKRSSEVWTLLGAVKTEFSKFGQALEKTQKKLREASNTIEKAAGKSRMIERKLKDVEQLPSQQASELFEELPESYDENETGLSYCRHFHLLKSPKVEYAFGAAGPGKKATL